MFKRYKNWKWQALQIFYIFCVVSTILSLVFVSIHAVIEKSGSEKAAEETAKIQDSEEETEENEKKENTASIAFTGDLMLEYNFYNYIEDDNYSFKDYLKPVYDLLEADLTITNLEVPIGGEELGLSGANFTFNAPSEIAREIAKTPINFLTLANNHFMDRGQAGINNTIAVLDEYSLGHTGAYADEESAQEISYVEINGIKIAILAYTYGTNQARETTYGVSSFMINRVFTDELRNKVEGQIQEARENSDFVIVAAHWGGEFTYTLSDTQLAFAEFLVEQGVDLIIGNHPHNIQGAEIVENPYGKKTYLFYSMGNFTSAAAMVSRASLYFANMYEIGAIGRVNLIKDEATGNVTVDEAEIIPIVNHFEDGYTSFSLMPLREYTEELAAKHLQAVYSPDFTLDWLKEQVESVFSDSGMTLVID